MVPLDPIHVVVGGFGSYVSGRRPLSSRSPAPSCKTAGDEDTAQLILLGAAPYLNARLTKVEILIFDGDGRAPLKPRAEGLNHVAVHNIRMSDGVRLDQYV